MTPTATQQLVIRITDKSLSFYSGRGGEEGVRTEPYVVKGGISMAANLREAFRTSQLLGCAGEKCTVLIDAPTMLVPLEDFQAEEMEEQFRHVFPSSQGMAIEMSVLPAFRCMAVFGFSKDLRTVLTDHFAEMRIKPVMASVWDYLLKRSYGGNNKKLYAYFHDGKMELCSFARSRFVFANSFEVDNMHDALYFILGAWKEIGGIAATDDLFLAGRFAEREQLMQEARKFIARVFNVNPSADFNRAPATQNISLPLDIMLEFV